MSDDAFLRWNVRPGTVLDSWREKAATGLLQVGRTGVPTLTVVGPASDAAALVGRALAVVADVRRMTLPARDAAAAARPAPGDPAGR